MKDKIKLLEMGAKKAALDKNFMAFILNCYSEIEKKSQSELMDELCCLPENFYKLGLCKVPDTLAPNFIDRLEMISHYTDISVQLLTRIIRRVDAVRQFSSNQSNHNFLMAARDRDTNSE